MSRPTVPDRDSLPLDVIDHIDRLCDRFETDWNAGNRPPIEPLLDAIDPAFRAALLRDLLAAEIDARRRLGESPQPAEYDARFPGEPAAVEAAFASGRSRPPLPSELPTVGSPDDHDRPRDASAAAPDRGTRVRYFGDYEIRRELGRGGMGVVYEARQISLNRPVALKMIRSAEFSTEEELRRLQNEAEAIATLDHPHIVPIHEVGDHDGQRYFTMKLIPGGSLAARIGRFRNDPRAAATLLATVAEAVHHAHQRAILHRDLKPANILLDDRGRPHVSDFGLAKRLETDSDLSVSGQILGTPAYMAPEQASGRRGGVTTVSDVYGLGAILYALLTGKPPFGGDSVVDTLDQVRNQPPEPPSKLNASIPRDLETIALKCLEKDPRRRYPSAQAVADDLTAWLDSRPITARPTGPAERAWLWCKRRPAIAALSLATALTLTGGTATVIAVQTRANTLLNVQRLRAEDREKQAIDAVKRFGDTVAGSTELMRDPALVPLRRSLLGEPLAFFRRLRESLQSDRDTRPESLERLAAVAFELGILNGEIGDLPGALQSYRESQLTRQELVNSRLAPTTTRFNLAATLTNMATIQRRLGAHQDALDSTGRAEEIVEGALRDDPTDLSFRHHLGVVLMSRGQSLRATGQPEEALEAERRALNLFEQLDRDEPTNLAHRASLASGHMSLGVLQREMNRAQDALVSFSRARDEYERLSRDEPARYEFARERARSLSNLGNLYVELGELEPAFAELSQARAIYERLVNENPTLIDAIADLTDNHRNIAAIHLKQGQLAEAAGLFEKAREMYERLASDHPRIPDFRRALADLLVNLSDLEEKLGHEGPARSLLKQAIGAYTRLAEEYPEEVSHVAELGATHNRLGMMDVNANRLAPARFSFVKAASLIKKALLAQPDNPDFRRYAWFFYGNLRAAATRLGDAESAREADVELNALGTPPGTPSSRPLDRAPSP